MSEKLSGDADEAFEKWYAETPPFSVCSNIDHMLKDYCRQGWNAALRAAPPSSDARAEYERKNPLGGPATMFEAMASRIRAGEDYHAVLADYDLCVVNDTPAIATLKSCGGPQQTLVNDIPDGVVLCNDGNYAVDIGTASPTYGWLLQRGLNKNWITCRKAADDEIARAKTHHRIASSLHGSPQSETPQPEGLAKYIGNRKPENTAPETAQPPASEAVALAEQLKSFADYMGGARAISIDQRNLCYRAAAALRADGGSTVPEGMVRVERQFLKDLADLYECNLHWGKMIEELRTIAATPSACNVNPEKDNG